MSGSAVGVETPVSVSVSVALPGTYVKPVYSLSTNWMTETSPAVSLITACEYPFGEHCATGDWRPESSDETEYVTPGACGLPATATPALAARTTRPRTPRRAIFLMHSLLDRGGGRCRLPSCAQAFAVIQAAPGAVTLPDRVGAGRTGRAPRGRSP